MTEKPVIAIGNFHPFITRNILDAGVLDALKPQAQKIVIFVPKEKEEYLKGLYEKDNVEIIGINFDTHITSSANRLFSRVAELLLDTFTKRNHQKVYLAKTGKRLKYYAGRLVMLLTGHRPMMYIAQPLFRWLDYTFNNPDVFGPYLSSIQPDIAFVTDPFAEIDVLFAKSARKHAKKYVSMVRSWDNLSNKSLLRFIPDLFIVQNEVMKGEAVRYHLVPEKSIRISGVPQFEYYARYTPIGKQEFAAQMGLDPHKRYILYSPAGQKFIDTDWQVCEILKTLYKENKIPEDVQFLVRLHPQNFTDLSKFTPDENFVIEDPGVGFKTDRVKEIEMSRQNVNHLADELHHSAMIINVVSSIVIDAAVMDRPVITIGFNGWEKTVPFLKSVEREHGEEWIKVLFDTGVTPIVKNPDELALWINRYLENQNEGQGIRKKFVDEHCYKFDGKSHERIASFVIEAQHHDN